MNMQFDPMDLLRQMGAEGYIECEDNGGYCEFKDAGGHTIKFDDPNVPGRTVSRFPRAIVDGLRQKGLLDSNDRVSRLSRKGLEALDPFNVSRSEG
jgi:hypothetical protein